MLPGKYPRALALTADGNSHLVDIKEVCMVVVASFSLTPFMEYPLFFGVMPYFSCCFEHPIYEHRSGDVSLFHPSSFAHPSLFGDNVRIARVVLS